MNTQKVISIIMPVQNTEAYLPDCLDSIIAQSYENWELIAVNDHSSDQSFKILNEYSKRDERIIALNSEGSNILAALQTGFSNCTGELICRMDSDDLMHENKLELLLEKLHSCPMNSIAAGSVKYFSDERDVGDGFSRYAKWLNSIALEEQYWTELFKECVIPSCCWIMRRHEFEKIGGFNGTDYPEDYDFCFRLYQSDFQVHGITEQIHFWRDRENRASRTKSQYADNRFFRMKVKYFSELELKPNSTLFLWGAGQNGKDLATELTKQKIEFRWLSNNPKKIGKHIYGIKIESEGVISAQAKKQIIIAVSNETDKAEIKNHLLSQKLLASQDFWFFL